MNRFTSRWGEVNWLFKVTIKDISVIYMTAHRCAGGLKKELYLRSGSQRHRHFVGFFNVPVQAPTLGQPFIYIFSEKPPHLVAFYDTLGKRRTHSRLNPPGPHGAFYFENNSKLKTLQKRHLNTWIQHLNIKSNLTAWTTHEFRVLNPHQWSIAQQCIVKGWKLMPKIMSWITKKINTL